MAGMLGATKDTQGQLLKGTLGHVLETSENPHNGLQNRVPRFNSGRGLHYTNQYLARIFARTPIGGSLPAAEPEGHGNLQEISSSAPGVASDFPLVLL